MRGLFKGLLYAGRQFIGLLFGGFGGQAPPAKLGGTWAAEAGGRIWYSVGGNRQWAAEAGNRVWFCLVAGHCWLVEPGGRVWIAGGRDMGTLVRNELSESVPGSGQVRLAMDFGDLPELQDPAVSIASCTVSVATVTSPLLTATSPATLDTRYRVSSVFSGGLAGTNYNVIFTPTLSTGQQLPPRTAVLKLT